MKILLFNGSPRKGCTSCFACKVKDEKCNGVCARRDEIRPLLEAASDADGMIFATPVYLHGATAQFRAFLERLLFPVTTYMVDDEGRRVRYLGNQVIPTGLICTMNNNEDRFAANRYDILLGINRTLLETAYGYCEQLNAYDTLQFTDYQKYNANLFDPEKKKNSRISRFPKDLDAAFTMGKRIAEMAAHNK